MHRPMDVENRQAASLLDFQKASVRSISGLGPPDPLVIPLVCGLGGGKFWDFLGVGGLLKILHVSPLGHAHILWEVA